MDVVLVLCWHYTGSFLVILHVEVCQISYMFSLSAFSISATNFQYYLSKTQNRENFALHICWWKISRLLSSLISFASLPSNAFSLLPSSIKASFGLHSIKLCFTLHCSICVHWAAEIVFYHDSALGSPGLVKCFFFFFLGEVCFSIYILLCVLTC